MSNHLLFQFSIFIIYFTAFSSSLSRTTQCKKPGLVALTFDDGPSPNGGTARVLEVLREEGVQATFFVTGEGFDSTYLDEDVEKQDLLRQIFYEGHQIGSHSWSHYNFTEKSIDVIRQDIQKLATVVENTIGINMTVFRAPYGEASDEVVELIEKEFGYRLIHWSIDTLDWLNREDTESSLKNYKDNIRNSKDLKHSFISLHHCPAVMSWKLARKAIKFVKSKGFKFVTVAECIGINDFNYLY